MEITKKLKERFCKDCNIPIKIFDEPYFTERLELYDSLYGTISKWNIFIKELEKYKCEQDYFEEYNKVKDEAIMCIKSTEAYQRFNEEDMNKYRVKHTNIACKDIFHPSNDGKVFISIDMKKANFSSLHHYDHSMFKEASTWENFISLFTDNKHIINSKYIRQVILGNCNPKRHITYEKFLMDNVLDILEMEYENILDNIVLFSNDEIIIEYYTHYTRLKRRIQSLLTIKCPDIPFRVELFKLRKIKGINGYYKEIFKLIGETEIELKCVNKYMLPFVIRKIKGQEPSENDKVFYHEELLSKFITIPEIML